MQDLVDGFWAACWKGGANHAGQCDQVNIAWVHPSTFKDRFE